MNWIPFVSLLATLAVTISLYQISVNAHFFKEQKKWFNFYENIISESLWSDEIDSWDIFDSCWKGRVIPIDWLFSKSSRKRQYIFFPEFNDNWTTDDTSDDITNYDDWLESINSDDCLNELKDNYDWNFDLLLIEKDWIFIWDENKTIFMWKTFIDENWNKN